MTVADEVLTGSTDPNGAPAVDLVVRTATYLLKVGDRYVKVAALPAGASPEPIPVPGAADPDEAPLVELAARTPSYLLTVGDRHVKVRVLTPASRPEPAPPPVTEPHRVGAGRRAPDRVGADRLLEVNRLGPDIVI